MTIRESLTALKQAKTDISNAILQKGGTLAEHAGMAEFAAGVSSIPAGAGDSDRVLKELIEGTLTEVESDAVALRESIFQFATTLVKASFPFAESIGRNSFFSTTNLREISAPAVKTIGQNAFRSAGLEIIDFPNAIELGDSAFDFCITKTRNLPNVQSAGRYALRGTADSVLSTISLPSLTTAGNEFLRDNPALTSASLGNLASIPTQSFAGDRALITVILRKTDGICTLSNSNAFISTPIAAGTGYIYVPKALVQSYKTATNWVTYATQIRAIESYPTITGGMQ